MNNTYSISLKLQNHEIGIIKCCSDLCLTNQEEILSRTNNLFPNIHKQVYGSDIEQLKQKGILLRGFTHNDTWKLTELGSLILNEIRNKEIKKGIWSDKNN